jgi:magnesium transporter
MAHSPEALDAAPTNDEAGYRRVAIWDPQPGQLDRLGAELGLHELIVEDAVKAHQRPKLERYGDTVFLVLKDVSYDDDRERLDVGDVLVAFSPRFVVAVGHSPAQRVDLTGPRSPDLAPDLGAGVAVHAVVDQVVDRYGPAIEALEVDVREIETTVFGPSDEQPTQRIYLLKRQIIELLRNIRPLLEPLSELQHHAVPGIDDRLGDYFRDVDDHLQRAILRAENASELLTEMLDANLAQVGLRQNEDMRKMSAWAAIFLEPTLLAGVWGMNFANMPELDWRFGYPLALAAMLAASAAMYRRFKHSGWL